MKLADCTEGRKVWARAGSYGWRPARIARVKRNGRIAVVFESGAGGNGSRHHSDLRPRDPALNGKDKPTVQEAAEQSAREEG